MTRNSKMKIGIIPDGNRKYSKKMGINLAQSYRLGAEKAFSIVKRSLERSDIDRIVFYALAENNMARSDEEVAAVIEGIKMFHKLVQSEASISIQSWGNNNDDRIKDLFTQQHGLSPALHIDLLINYSPEWDFETRPIRTNEIPDLDLVIRSSPIPRLSGFLPRQSAYAVIAPMGVYWEEFDVALFDEVIDKDKDGILEYVSGI